MTVGIDIFKGRWEGNDVWYWFYILSSNAEGGFQHICRLEITNNSESSK